LLLLNKREGLTSFETLGAIKRALGTGKVGHTGTLDKFARGLLVVLAGRALKLSTWFSHCDKQYEGLMRFGAETDTLDPEGSIVAEAPLPDRETVERILPRFTGAIMQAPPAYSAIHIGGKRASALARAGETVEMQKRAVTVYKLELRSWEPPFAAIFVHCSSGTYIRSLARDIALAAGSRAHLAALARTHVAGFSLADALDSGGDVTTALRPIDRTVFSALGIPCFEVDGQDAEQVTQGKPLARILNDRTPSLSRYGNLPAVPSSSAGIFCGGDFIAMVENDGGTWKYRYVYGKMEKK
jgi:tRNA pseudouridine55 synthase